MPCINCKVNFRSDFKTPSQLCDARMEIEKVAAHNADVYNPGRGSAQKRKRGKAKEQLRNRMRRRNNGPSTSMVSTRLRSSHHDKGDSILGPGVKPMWESSRPTKHNSKEEWRAQEARYATLTHADGRVTDWRSRQTEDVPLTELVDRVIQRRGHTTTESSPLTIRALKPPAPPYVIQQQTLIRKIVHVQPINTRKPSNEGPYVVVLKRGSSTNKHNRTSKQDPRDLPPLKQPNNSSEVEIGTWRPELATYHDPYVHPNAEDRSVTNYRLQMQQAVKIAELRCDFSTSAKPMHHHAPLPAIQVAYEVADKECPVDPKESSPETNEPSRSLEHNGEILNPNSAAKLSNGKLGRTGRFTSSQDVLNQMKTRKQSKKRKTKADDFNNPLRTRSRYTAKTKQFKEDLQRVHELSAIQEDQSSISDRLSKLSAGRTSSVASFRSVASLKRIEEAEVPIDGCIKRRSGKQRSVSVHETQTADRDSQSSNKHSETSLSSKQLGNTSDAQSGNRLTDPNEISDRNAQQSSLDNNTGVSGVEDSCTQDELEINRKDKPIAGQSELILTDDNRPSSADVSRRISPEQVSDMVWVPGPGSPIASLVRETVGQNHSRDTGETTLTEANQSGNNQETKTVIEDRSSAMETSVQQSVDRFVEMKSPQGIAAETFDKRDIILPAETVQ